MALQEPESIEDLFYFTNRVLQGKFKGFAKVWVFKELCPKCKQAYMQKPRRGGKPVKSAKYYECPNCGYQEPAQEYESKLVANVKYKCPNCGFEGELQTPFHRKKVRGVLTFSFQCQSCGNVINIEKFKK